MNKRIRNILLTCFILIVIFLSSYLVLKMNHFDFKKFSFVKNNYSSNLETDENNEELEDHEEDIINEEDILPSDEDVIPETTTSSTGNNTTKKTTTKVNNNKNTSSNNTTTNTIPKVSTVKFDNDINSVKLNPIKTRLPELDNKVGNILDSITNSNMTNNQKLYAIFRYIIDHSEYGNGFINGNELNNLINDYHYNSLDGSIVYEARKILFDGVGVCDDYASLFVVMARRVGFEAYYVGGSVKRASGGTTPHAWVNIVANGVYYVFDVQIADKRPEQEKYYYGKTDKEITIYTYNNRDSYIKRFNKFKEITPLNLQVKLSGAINDNKTVTSYYDNITKNVNYNTYVNQTLNFNVVMSGASKYKYDIKVINSNGISENLYVSDNDPKNNINFSYKFLNPGNFRFYISVWSRDNGIIAEYYFNVNVSSDDRIEDLNISVIKDQSYINFNPTVRKVDSTSSCVPIYEFKVISTNDPVQRLIYSDGNSYKMDYDVNYDYTVKVTARCGQSTLEKDIAINKE